MKKIVILSVIGFAAIVLASCKGNIENLKDIRYMGIRFKPLSRADMTLVGNLQAESTIAFTVDKKGGVHLSGPYAKNIKTGLVSNQKSTTEIMYFAPGAGESVTGSLYDESVIQEVSGSIGGARAAAKARREARLNQYQAAYNKNPNFFNQIRLQSAKAKAVTNDSDSGLDFAYYALVEKYPDIDYFINVRFDRKTTAKGGLFTETIIVKADGVKLRTD